MKLTKGYALDEAGDLIPPGLSRHTYDWNCLMGEALPAWLQTPKTDGTSGSTGSGFAVAHSASSPGYYAVQTGSTMDAVARLATVPIPLDQYAAVMIQFFGVQFSNANAADASLPVTVSFGVNSISYTGGPSGNAGARVIQRDTDSHARFVMPGVAGDHMPFGASYRTLREQYRFRNMGFLLYRSGQAVVFEDDPANPVGTLDAASTMLTVGGSAMGNLMVQNKSTVNQTIRLGGARLTLWREPRTL